jgi:hypothetical protein
LNYAKGGKTIGVNDRIDARIDWAKSEHFSVFGRVTKAWEKDIAPVLFGNGLDNNFSDQNPRRQIVIGATYVPTPTWVTNVLLATLVGQAVSAFQRSHPSPYVQSYSVDFQHQLSNTTMVEVGVFGNSGTKAFLRI